MKPNKADHRIEDSLVNLLLPVARLLVSGGIGIDELMHAAKRAYLSEAMQAVARQGGRVSISRLSVATGMTRKEVSALLSESPENKGPGIKRSGQQRALRVLKGWLSDPRFQGAGGRPAELPYGGNHVSFTLLVKLYGGDVTPKSVLRELERIEVVDVTRAGALRLRPSRNRNNIEIQYKLSDLAKMFKDFACAVTHPNPGADAPAYFGFRESDISSVRDAAHFMRRFSRRAAALLEDFQQWEVGKTGSSASPSSADSDRARIGLGVYLLRSDLKPTRRAGGERVAAARIRASRR